MSDLINSMRPRSLDEMIGADEIVTNIRGHLANGNSPKAYLFTGQTGGGKTTLSRIMSVALQCGHVEEFGQYCSKCYHNRHSFDITEINAARIRKIEELESMLDGYNYAPMPGSRRRVYILDEAHMLSKHSQNLMLKFTEDCPSTTKWIIGSTEPTFIRKTLRRRCQIYQVEPLEYKDIKRLVRRGLQKSKSNRSVSDLAEQLLEKHITSPGLIVKAIQKYVDTKVSAEKAANVDLSTNIDTLALCNSVIKGSWEDVANRMQSASYEDMPEIRGAIQGYLKAILLGDVEFSHRTDKVANCILKLHEVRDEVPAVSAVLYKLCKYFSGDKR